MEKVKLKIARCSTEAAKYACVNWHYSKSLPSSKLIKYGVWEDEKFIGCVIYGRGANNNIGKPFNLEQTQICELVRVALTTHITPVTRIIAITLKMLKKENPDLLKVISYADKTNQGHEGIIYKAGNWQQLPDSVKMNMALSYKGKIYHGKTLTGKFGSRKNFTQELKNMIKSTPPQVKHKFVYDLR